MTIEILIKRYEKNLKDLIRWKSEGSYITNEEIIDLKNLIKKLKRKKSITVEEKDVRVFFDWLIKHKRSESVVIPNQKVMFIAKKYGWLFNGHVYRGLKLHSWVDKDKMIMRKRKGDKIRYKSKEYESWTTNKGIATSFTIGNQPKYLERKYIVLEAKRYGRQGIVIKVRIKKGLDIPKAINKVEKEAEYQENLHYYLGKMPMFGSEGEILGQSVGLVEIIDKINC